MNDPRHQTTDEWLSDYDNAGEVTPISSAANYKEANLDKPKSQPRFSPPKDLDTRIPEGNYKARCLRYVIGQYRGDGRITFKFEISTGKFKGVRLDCFFNVNQEVRSNGDVNMVPGPRSNYFRQMTKLFLDIRKAGGDWLNPDHLVGKQFRVEVRDVTSDFERNDLGECTYSKISYPLELEER